MSKGIVLVAFGEPCYGMAAWNLAVSVKFHNPTLPIFLLHDSKCFSKGNFDFSVFDDQKIISPDYTSPANTKVGIYNELPYDCNLFLDVDAVCLQNLEPLFESLKGKGYATVVSKGGEEWAEESLAWADDKTIKEHYDIDERIPRTQTSIQYIEKCDLSEKIFEKLNDNLRNPIPLTKLRKQWGGSQPDELYLNVALAQLSVNPPIGDNVIFFGRKNTLKNNVVKDSFHFLSIYGGRNFTRPIYTKLYDDLLIQYCKPRNHAFKSHVILAKKHSGKPENKAITFAGKPRRKAEPQAIIPHTITPYKILVKFPTRQRPEKFLNCLGKAFELANDKENIRCLVTIDDNDMSMTNVVMDKAKELGSVEFISGISTGKIHAVNRDMEQSGEWDILILLSDDMECETKGWDDIIRSKFDQGKDRLLHFNDGYVGQRLVTLPVMDRPYYDRLGYIYHNDYISLWCDNEQMEVSKILKKYRYYPQVLFRHKMHSNGFPQDELHKYTEGFYHTDQKTFERRRKINFDLDKLKAAA